MSDDQAHKATLWRRCIAIVRLLLILTLTLLITLTLSLGRLLLPVAAKRRWRAWHFRVWSRGVCRILGGYTQIHGSPPDAPFFIASNHLSYLDILVLAQFLPCRFIAKSDVKHWPIVGTLTRLADTLYIDRTRRTDIPRANAAIHAALTAGDSVALFPEGTSSDSDLALPMRAPLLQVAAEANIDVHTAALSYRTDPGDPNASEAICYFGDDVFGTHIWRLLHLRGFSATLRFSPQPVRAADRKILAASVRDSIHALQSLNHQHGDKLSDDTLDAPPLSR